MGGYFGCLESFGAVNVAECADAGNRAEVDEFNLVFGGDDVFGFEVVVHYAALVQVVHGGEEFEDVADGEVDAEHAVGLGFAAVFQGGAVDVFHDDESAGDAGSSMKL